jgi:hypothetical protein
VNPATATTVAARPRSDEIISKTSLCVGVAFRFCTPALNSAALNGIRLNQIPLLRLPAKNAENSGDSIAARNYMHDTARVTRTITISPTLHTRIVADWGLSSVGGYSQEYLAKVCLRAVSATASVTEP